MMKRVLWNWLVLFSHLLNVLSGGDPQESLSGRSYRQKLWTRKYIDLFFLIITGGVEQNHCLMAHVSERVHAREKLGLYERGGE